MVHRLRAATGTIQRFQWQSDAVLAGVILVGSLADVIAGRSRAESGWHGPLGVQILLAVLASVPLLARRRYPLAVLAIVLGTLVAAGALAAPVQGPFEPFVASIVALYSAGAHLSERRGVVALALYLGVMFGAGIPALLTDNIKGGDFFPTLVWVGVAWFIGRVIRSRHLRTLELEELTEQLAREREERARLAVAHERARIARELHDVIAHNVSVMVIQAGAAGRVLDGEQPVVRGALETIEETGRQTVDEMKSMLGVLRRQDEDEPLTPQPSLRHLEALAEQLRTAGLRVELLVEGEPRPLPAGLDLSAYRIVQEALTNSLKHAGDARARVTLRYGDGSLELEVVDDGAGDGRGHGTGNGLIGMRERVALYGGQLEAGRRPTGGYLVRARLPLGAGAA